jgi:hypothetical protein
MVQSFNSYACAEESKLFLKLFFNGQPHEKLCEIMIWDVSFGLN